MTEDGPGGSTLPSKATLPWNIFDRAALGFVSAEAYDLAKMVAYMQAVELTGVTLKNSGTHWVCMIKGFRRGKPVVAFEDAPTLQLALDYGLYHASMGTLSFGRDKHPYKGVEPEIRAFSA